MFGVYSLTPAPWGDDFRLVEMYDNRKSAVDLIKVLEENNILFYKYKIIEWDFNSSKDNKVDDLLVKE